MTDKTIVSPAEKSLIQLILTNDLIAHQQEFAKQLIKFRPKGLFKSSNDAWKSDSVYYTYTTSINDIEYKIELTFHQASASAIQISMLWAKQNGGIKLKYHGNGNYYYDDFNLVFDTISYHETITPDLIDAELADRKEIEEWRAERRERLANRKDELYKDVFNHYDRNTRPKNFDVLFNILKGFGNTTKIIQAMDKLTPLMR